MFACSKDVLSITEYIGLYVDIQDADLYLIRRNNSDKEGLTRSAHV